ncbi:MAG: VWA domain-containing protein [Planctomycetes bacterium]|nr:VWA domain-containing protein [Planctomycetota bacterium]
MPESDKGKSEERRDLPAAPATQPLPADHDGHNREQYDAITHNPFLDAKSNPLSTFSIDVDTASYANVRRLLNTNLLPPAGAARIEEMVNYFKYDYPAPDMKSETPFSVNVEVAPCPWRPKNRLARIGLRGKTFADDERPAANLVFLLDVSGSMKQPNKLPWVIASMQMLTRQLREKDRVAIAVYAGASGLVLDSTLCTEGGKETVQAALGRLQAGGSTNGGDGIRLAYKVAQEQFVKSGANRVILCTDGDWNVGTTNTSDLTDLITEKAKSGVFLTVLGFGMGNYNDGMLEKLADKGNGNYGYIDTVGEAARLLVEQAGGTLFTIAKDVKIQVEFNPKEVGAYRLIGYENRVLAARDFNDDKKDAGEIGAGHTVTALYELTPPGVATPGGDVDPLRYQQAGDASDKAETGEMFVVKLRYKKPDGDVSTKVEHPVREQKKSLGDTSRDFRFASAVAAFGMILRRAPEDIRGGATYALVSELATEAAGQDDSRREFLTLVAKAQALDTGR